MLHFLLQTAVNEMEPSTHASMLAIYKLAFYIHRSLVHYDTFGGSDWSCACMYCHDKVAHANFLTMHPFIHNAYCIYGACTELCLYTVLRLYTRRREVAATTKLLCCRLKK